MIDYPRYVENDWSSIQEFCRWAAQGGIKDNSPRGTEVRAFWTKMVDDLEFCKTAWVCVMTIKTLRSRAAEQQMLESILLEHMPASGPTN